MTGGDRVRPHYTQTYPNSAIAGCRIYFSVGSIDSHAPHRTVVGCKWRGHTCTCTSAKHTLAQLGLVSPAWLSYTLLADQLDYRRTTHAHWYNRNPVAKIPAQGSSVLYSLSALHICLSSACIGVHHVQGTCTSNPLTTWPAELSSVQARL